MKFLGIMSNSCSLLSSLVDKFGCGVQCLGVGFNVCSMGCQCGVQCSVFLSWFLLFDFEIHVTHFFIGASRYSMGKMEPAQYGTVTGSAHSAHRPPMVRINFYKCIILFLLLFLAKNNIRTPTWLLCLFFLVILFP